MAKTRDPKDRAVGMIWRAVERDDAPATHVLIVGVGQFQSTKLAPLRSTVKSARDMANWFLPGETKHGNGFQHPSRPLGSLAIVLSDPEAPPGSEVDGAPVPRATFDNVKAALRAWVARAEVNEDSAAILAIFSHGQAERRRTAVLFEDAGMDPEDVHAGMTEAEQLINALSTRIPRDKLVIFDCCRMEVKLNLPHQGDIGRALIGEVADRTHHRPQVMMATQYDGFSFGGADGRPTLLGAAILEALNGCAADITDNWQVNSRRLGEITQKILGLWQEGSEELQVPDTQDNRAFIVTQGTERDELTLFVNLTEGHDIRQSRIALYQGSAAIHDSTEHGDPEPFARIIAPAGHPLRLLATKADGTLIGEDTWRAYPPVAFRKLPTGPRLDPMVTKVRAKTIAGKYKTILNFPSIETGAGREIAEFLNEETGTGSAIVTFDRSAPHDQASEHIERDFVLGSHINTDLQAILPSGNWVMNLRRPGLPPVTRYLKVDPGDLLRINISPVQPPHEWLTNAVVAGVLAADTPPSDGPEAQGPVLHQFDDSTYSSLLKPVASDGRFTLYQVRDEKEFRFQKWQGSADPANRPVWITGTGISADGRRWRERAFLPLLGGFFDYGGSKSWRVELLTDATPVHRGAHLASYAVSQQWGPLLAFLGRRAFPDAGAALRALYSYQTRQAVHGKRTNPFAAICGALVAVATSQTEALGIPDEWLENLCNWFPTLPDGAVILARHRLMQGQDASALLDEALARGTPVTSLAVDWLSEALSMIGHPRAAEARETAMSCDPHRTFTVLHLPEEQA